MKQYLWLAPLLLTAQSLVAQSFEISGVQESYKALIGETIKAPVRLKNTTNRQITLIVSKLSSQIGGTQKNYLCLDNDCFDHKADALTVKLEPGQSSNQLAIALEAGLAAGHSSVRYSVANGSNPAEYLEVALHFTVEESAEKQSIYSSRHIILRDLYPNPVSDHAFVEYTLLTADVAAKIAIHNILGNTIEEYPLPFTESKVKIGAGTLNAGIYFYTLYLDDEGVVTRKLIVKR